MNWQLIIVGLLIVAAAGMLLRRGVGVLRSGMRKSSGCGGCSSCANTASPPVVTLETFEPPRRS